MKKCRCGCDADIPDNATWASGCDSRALHARIKECWGSTEAFVDWYDTVTHEPKLGESRVPTTVKRRVVT